ncbi:hypothetical protein BJY24_003987 [Nocardia transvalensis]|uniref:Uncharacterized protein n=1 Tax=Nocardia transvalensis TaxID=37333 RepID=A0A7W9UJX2_9NOCA|nr:hypothetical protein [Nocardia transvalensis]MBB5915120.1 hypothetical protein [Nocardia transvalensis]
MADHTGARTDAATSVLVLSEHAGDGWELSGAAGDRRLLKDFGAVRARIRTTTPTSCSWWVGRPDGRLLREASAASVAEAKAAAESWVAAYLARER